MPNAAQVSLSGRNLGTFASYVDPWASCPACGASVFFYQSPNGGRVFFDQLGPPWPRHACTTGTSLPKVRLSSTDHPDAKRPPPSWIGAGWRPLLKATAADLTPDLMRLEGVYGEDAIHLYVPKFYLRALPAPIDELSSAPILIKVAESGVYRIEILGPGARPVVLMAYQSMADALSRAELKIPLRSKVVLLVNKKDRRPTR